jgi:hypothetical protein
MANIEYVAGVCNIGPEEIKRRRNVGWGSLAVAVIILALLVWAGVNPWWRLVVFFPAMLSASGFLQAYFQFCAGFARRGVFNFGTLGQQETISDDASKTKDHRKGNQIGIYAALIGVVVALICVIV